MEKNFGGPVWHASVSAGTETRAVQIAEAALDGVGDASLGEWRERGMVATHIKRRLSLRECIEYGLSMIDMRNTDDGRTRLRKLFQQHPHLRAHAVMIGEA